MTSLVSVFGFERRCRHVIIVDSRLTRAQWPTAATAAAESYTSRHVIILSRGRGGGDNRERVRRRVMLLRCNTSTRWRWRWRWRDDVTVFVVRLVYPQRGTRVSDDGKRHGRVDRHGRPAARNGAPADGSCFDVELPGRTRGVWGWSGARRRGGTTTSGVRIDCRFDQRASNRRISMTGRARTEE